MTTVFRTAIFLGFYSVIAAVLTVISLWFGYLKKSTSVTIVTGGIVSSIFGSFSSEILLAEGIIQGLIVVIVEVLSVLAALFLIIMLSKRIRAMEV